eukprot:sb/3477456/
METNQQPSTVPAARRRITTRRHTVTEISSPETPAANGVSTASSGVSISNSGVSTTTTTTQQQQPVPPPPTKGCRSQANDVTVDELAGYMENALFIPRPMSTMAEMMYA